MKRHLIFLYLFIVSGLLLSGCDRSKQQEQEHAISEPAHYDPLFQRDENCDFRGIRWGMSPEEVKVTEDMEVFEEGPDLKQGKYFIYYKDIPFRGFERVGLRYFFIENKCFLGVYYFYQIDESGHHKLLQFSEEIYGTEHRIFITSTHWANSWKLINNIVLLKFFPDTDIGKFATLMFISEQLAPHEWIESLS